MPKNALIKENRKEDIVLDNIRRTIGRFKARATHKECAEEQQTSLNIVQLLEATIRPIYEAIEEGYHLRRNVRGVLYEVLEQFRFMEEIAEYEVEGSLYEEAMECISIILDDYLEPIQSFPKVCVYVGDRCMKHGRKLTRKQCQLVESYGYSPSEWLLERHTENGIVLVHKVTKELSPPVKEGSFNETHMER